MSGLNEFKKDLQDNEHRGSNERADRFKVKDGDNKVVILTNPIGFSQIYLQGKGYLIAYEDCGYGKYASRKYKCYVLDMTDNMVKIADFSYTVAKDLVALADGARTKFEGFPMPYVLNLKTEKAGTKEVETKILADEDYIPTPDVVEQLEKFSPIQEVIDRLKSWTKKQVEEDPDTQQKVQDFMDRKAKEDAEYQAKRKKDTTRAEHSIPRGEDVETIEYPDDDINAGEIPF